VTPSRIVAGFYNDNEEQEDPSKLFADFHPAIQEVGLKLITDKFVGTNQTTVSVLMAVKEVVREFDDPNYHRELLALIRDKICPCLEKCRRLFSGTDYALKLIRQ